jgi:hypothetical protein
MSAAKKRVHDSRYQGAIKPLLRRYYGAITAPSRHDEGAIKAQLRRYWGAIAALLKLY